MIIIAHGMDELLRRRRLERHLTIVAVDGISVPRGVDADHVPDLVRVIAANCQSVSIAHRRRVDRRCGVRTAHRYITQQAATVMLTADRTAVVLTGAAVSAQPTAANTRHKR